MLEVLTLGREAVELWGLCLGASGAVSNFLKDCEEI